MEEDNKVSIEDACISKLHEVCPTLKQNNAQLNVLKKIVDEQKTQVKELFQKLGVSSFDDGSTYIYETIVEKSTLDELRTIQYLKDHGLEKYIKIKEYFDPAELVYAATNGEFNVEDLAPFKIDKTEIRLNIK